MYTKDETAVGSYTLKRITDTLSDGTVVALHECKDPERQLRVATEAIRTYRDFHGYLEGDVRVDVDDFFRVSLRPIGQDDR